MKKISQNEYYKKLLAQITNVYQKGRQSAVITVNSHLVNTYWLIGQYIVEYEQAGHARATYGNALSNDSVKTLALLWAKVSASVISRE